jgi:hypothetical protein
VKKPATFQTKEETTDNLRAGDVGGPSTLKSYVPTNRKKKWQYAYKLLETIRLKEGAMRHNYLNVVRSRITIKEL